MAGVRRRELGGRGSGAGGATEAQQPAGRAARLVEAIVVAVDIEDLETEGVDGLRGAVLVLEAEREVGERVRHDVDVQEAAVEPACSASRQKMTARLRAKAIRERPPALPEALGAQRTQHTCPCRGAGQAPLS